MEDIEWILSHTYVVVFFLISGVLGYWSLTFQFLTDFKTNQQTHWNIGCFGLVLQNEPLGDSDIVPKCH